MASINEMQDALEKLINDEGGESLPGLEFEPVVNNFIDVKFKDQLEAAETEEDREELRNSLLKYYMNEGKEEITQNINMIKQSYSAAKSGLESILTSALKTTASNAIPSVITVGTATSTPNPAYTVIENSQKKNSLLTTLKSISSFIVNMLISAIKIAFELPAAAMALITTLSSVKSTINAIPG